MIVRADDFNNKNVFMMIVEEAQDKNLIPKGPLAWDEKSVVDLDEIEINVVPCNLSQTYLCPDCSEPMSDIQPCKNPKCVRNLKR